MKTLTIKSRSWWRSEWDVLERESKVGSFEMVRKFTYREAKAQALGSQWYLKCEGWAGQRYSIQDSSHTPVMDAEISGWSAKFSIKAGEKTFILKSASWSGSRYAVIDESGREVLTVELGWWRSTAVFSYDESLLSSLALPLIFLVFYRIKMQQANTAATSAAAAGSATVVISH